MGAALDGAVGFALLWDIAYVEKNALGEADAGSVEHGRILLAMAPAPPTKSRPRRCLNGSQPAGAA